MRSVHSTAAGPGPRSSPRLRRLGAALAAGVLVLLAGWSLWFQLTLTDRLPDPGTLAAVAERIHEEARAGDAVLVVPDWADAVRAELDPALPVLAWTPDDPDLGRAAPRLWVVALPEAPRSRVDDALAILEARFGAPEQATPLGPVLLLRHRLRPGPATWRLVDHVAGARVAVGAQACSWRRRHRAGPRFQCPRGPWNFVAAQEREVDYRARRCVWAHPVDGAPLTLTLPAVPFRGRLALRAGLVGEAALEDRAPVTVAASAGGEALGEVTVAPAPGWQAFAFETPAGPAPLTLTLTTPDATRRPVCLDAWVEDAP